MRDVAIIGPLRGGKDSIADHLIEQYAFTRLTCAGPLKDEVVTALNAVEGGWDRERLEREKTALRPLLQVWGTEFRRAQDANYWVDKLAESIFRHAAGPLVITDARFRNEIEMLRDAGFRIVRLDMPIPVLRAHLKRVAGMTPEQIASALAHPSEVEWRSCPVDYSVLSVPGKLPELINAVTEIVLK